MEKWARSFQSPHGSVIHSPRGSPLVNKSCVPSMPENNPYVFSDVKFKRTMNGGQLVAGIVCWEKSRRVTRDIFRRSFDVFKDVFITERSHFVLKR